jgi:hypothetical protein
MSYDYLRQRITETGWVGKSILEITDTTLGFINAPKNWLVSTPPMQAILNSTPLGWILDSLEESQGLATDCGLLFLESSYAINKAYNSEKYEGQLMSKGNTLLNAFAVKSSDENIYLSGVEAYGTLSEFATELQKIQVVLTDRTGPYSPSAVITSLVDKAIARVQGLLAEIGEITKETSEKVKRKARDLKRYLKQMLGMRAKSINFENVRPRFVGSLVPINSATPSVLGGVNILRDIATWLMTNFLGLGGAAFPVEVLGYISTSIVVKYLGGVGADACRYLAGGLLRGAAEALPTLVAPTGLFAGCWGALMAYAPYIIFAAILTIIFLRHKQVLGEYLYVFGTNGKAIAYGSAKLFDTSREEMNTELIAMREKMVSEGFPSYPNLTGFAFNKKDEIVMCLDLTQNPPVPIYGKQAIALRFEPFKVLYEEGPLAM